MSRIIFYSGWYTPELCVAHPKKCFVFGDNLRRFGMGGQAIIRNNLNTYGIATKRKPSRDESAYFSEASVSDLDDVLEDIEGLWQRLRDYPDEEIVIPVTKDGRISLGLDRAELKQRAPTIYDTIVMHIEEMANVYGSRDASEL